MCCCFKWFSSRARTCNRFLHTCCFLCALETGAIKDFEPAAAKTFPHGTKYRPTPDREAFNHKTLRLQIQPARYPQMRPQHHVQPLTNPSGHAQEPHERYRCKTTTKTCCSNPPTACNRNCTRRRTGTNRRGWIILSLPLHLPHKSSPADSMSPAPPACCQTLPKHNVVWNCLGVVVAGFRSVAWVRCRHCVCVGSGSFCQLATDRALFCLLVLLCCSCVLCLALCVCFVAFLFARCQPMDCVLIHFSSLLYAHCRHD